MPAAPCFSGRTATPQLVQSWRDSRRGALGRKQQRVVAQGGRFSQPGDREEREVRGRGAGSSGGHNPFLDKKKGRTNQQRQSSSSKWEFEEEVGQMPWPSNLPTNPAGSAGAEEGYHYLERFPTSELDLDWGAELASLEERERASGREGGRTFVILFGVGQGCDVEGIYSLRALTKDDGLPVETIVAFENEDDAERYSTLLEATMDHQPSVMPILWGELLEFCNNSGYRCRLEARGSLLIPPDYNVGMTDWEKSLRLRRGDYQVLEAEPALPGWAASQEVHTDAGGLFIDGPDWVFEEAAAAAAADPSPASDTSNVVDRQLSDPKRLAQARADLERLL